MDIADIVATYIANNGFGTLGVDVFVSQAPEQTNCIWVERLAGTMNNYVPIEESVVNVYCKNTSGSEAVQTIENIKRFIHRMHTTELDLAKIYTFLIIGDVELVSRDLEYSSIYKVTVQVTYRDSNLIS
jgi:predicted membrane protein